MTEEQPDERREKLKSRLAFGALSFTAIILFFGVIGAAVWRVYLRDTPPPTPTVPAGLEPSVGYVSAVEGLVQSQLPGVEISVPLRAGDTVAAGPGALVRTGADGWLRLGFANGATFFLDSESEFELQQIAEAEGQLSETIAQINYGRMLVEAGSDNELALVIEAPTGARSTVEEGVMGLEYEPSSQRFDVHCLSGSCLLHTQAGQTLELDEGDASAIQGFSAPFDVRPAAFERFYDLGDPGLVPTATATEEDTTATASPTREEPTATVVTLEATEPLPTFTPRPSPTRRVFPTATETPAAQATAAPSATDEPPLIETGTATLPPASTVTATPPPTLTYTPEAGGTATGTATAPPAFTATPGPTGAALGTPTPSPTGSTATGEQLPVAVVTNAEWLNVRNGPGNEWEIMASVPRGTELELTGYRDEDGTWVSVRTPGDIEGWAHSFYLESDYPFEQLAVWPGATTTPTSVPGSD